MQAARLVLERLPVALGATRAARTLVAEERLVVRASSLVAPHAATSHVADPYPAQGTTE
jgi:hypothetical protein